MSKLPSYETLADLYRDGWTYEELGREYDAAKSTVYTVLRQGALERGEWPLCSEEARRMRISRGKTGSSSVELEDSSPIVFRLQTQLREFNGSCRQFCLENELRPTTVSDLLRGKKPKITKQLAERIRTALEQQQQQEEEETAQQPTRQPSS